MTPEEITTVSKQETITTEGPAQEDSSIFKVSIRAWIAVMLVSTVCFNYLIVVVAVLVESLITHDFTKVGTYTTITEPLYSLSTLATGFYFGQKLSKS